MDTHQVNVSQLMRNKIALPEYLKAVKPLEIEAADALSKLSPRKIKNLIVSAAKNGEADTLQQIYQSTDLIEHNIHTYIGLALDTAFKAKHGDVITVLLRHDADVNDVSAKNIVSYMQDGAFSVESRMGMMKQAVIAGLDLSTRSKDIVLPILNGNNQTDGRTMLLSLFEFGVCPHKLKRTCLNTGHRHYIKAIEEKYEQFVERNEQADSVEKSKDVSAKTITSKQNEPTSWLKFSDDSIAFIEHIAPTKTTFQTIFNFEACTVKTVVQIANAQPALQIQSFKSLDDTEQLRVAFNNLCAQGGTPKPFAGVKAEIQASPCDATSRLPLPISKKPEA